MIPSLASNTGGPALNLVDSIPHLLNENVEVTIFTTDMDAPASAPAGRVRVSDLPARARDYDVRMVNAQFPHRIAYAPQLRRLLAAELAGFDVVRIHGAYLYPHMVAARQARRAGVPYVVTPHGSLDPWIRQHGRMRKAVTQLAWQDRMFRNAAAIHTTTTRESDAISDLVPVDVPRYVVGNGIDVGAFSNMPERGSLRAELRLSDDTVVILFLGRISRKKGVDILIRALPRLYPRPVVLVIAGPDDEELTPSLTQLAGDLGVDSQVFFVGPRFGDDRLRALADADIWALTSHTENFGNAVLEAMASGAPTIVSSEVNISDELKAAQAAAVCRCDPADFASHCAALLDDPEKRQRLVTNGRVFVGRYDWSIISRQLRDMLELVRGSAL